MMQRRLMCPKNSMFGILSFKINPNFRPAIQTSCTHVLRGEVDQCWKEFDKKGNRLIIYILFKFWLDRSPVDLYCSFLCSNKGLETFFVLHTKAKKELLISWWTKNEKKRNFFWSMEIFIHPILDCIRRHKKRAKVRRNFLVCRFEFNFKGWRVESNVQ